MKYVRTKDNIYEIDFSRNETDICYFTTKGWVYKADVIKESDTILKLLDEIVVVEDNKHILTNTPYPLENNKTVYGAIWNDKGLIFVARLNMNNEWELI